MYNALQVYVLQYICDRGEKIKLFVITIVQYLVTKEMIVDSRRVLFFYVLEVKHRKTYFELGIGIGIGIGTTQDVRRNVHIREVLGGISRNRVEWNRRHVTG